MPFRTARFVTTAAGAAGVVLLAAGPAGAHIDPTPAEVGAGSSTAVTLTVPHGCDGSPTRQLTIQVPEGIDDVTPQVVPGWDVAVTTEALGAPVTDETGNQVTERDSEVTFTAQAGNELADGLRQTFTIGYKAPDTPGSYLFFKTIQTCVAGETAWIEEYSGEGEEPEHPAPAVLVTESNGDEHGQADHDDAAEDTGHDEANDESEDDSDSAKGIAIAGLVIGTLALLAAGASLARAR